MIAQKQLNLIDNTYIFQMTININEYKPIVIVDLSIIEIFILLFLTNKKEFFIQTNKISIT